MSFYILDNKISNFYYFKFLGTPGTGKTTLSTEVAQHTKLNYISITDLAKDNKFYLDYDSELESYELDEDKVIDEIDEIMKQGELYEIFHPKKRVFLILLGKSSSSSLPVFICVSMASFRFISILAACHNLPITHPMTLTYIKRKRNCVINLIFRNNSSTKKFIIFGFN
jgi:hypothetical protein